MKRPRGRWAKWYASVALDKVGYSDPEFRAFALLVALASEAGGEWRNRDEVASILDRLVQGSTGVDLTAFLIAKSDLHVRRGGRVELVGWPTYQGMKPDLTAAERQRRHRAGRVTVRDDSPALDTPIPVQPSRRDTVTPSYSLSSSHVAPSNGDARVDLDAWAQVRTVLDELTGRAVSVASPYGRLAEQALALVSDFGMDRTLAAFRRVAAAADHPDAAAIVLPANRMLRPITPAPVVEKQERAEERERARSIRQARDAEERRRFESWVADADPTAQDSGHRPRATG